MSEIGGDQEPGELAVGHRIAGFCCHLFLIVVGGAWAASSTGTRPEFIVPVVMFFAIPCLIVAFGAAAHGRVNNVSAPATILLMTAVWGGGSFIAETIREPDAQGGMIVLLFWMINLVIGALYLVYLWLTSRPASRSASPDEVTSRGADVKRRQGLRRRRVVRGS